MSKVVEFLKEQVEDHQRHLEESEEDAHTHVLFIRQSIYREKFVRDHFPDNPTTQEILALIRRERALVDKALVHKE